MACNEECAFFSSYVYNNHNLWSCQKVCDAVVYLLDNIFIRFGTKLYRQTIGIPMGTNFAPLVADLFRFCYERDFMKSLSRENQADIIEAFSSTSRYLDDLLNIDNIYFDKMVDRIYPKESQFLFSVGLCVLWGVEGVGGAQWVGMEGAFTFYKKCSPNHALRSGPVSPTYFFGFAF